MNALLRVVQSEQPGACGLALIWRQLYTHWQRLICGLLQLGDAPRVALGLTVSEPPAGDPCGPDWLFRQGLTLTMVTETRCHLKNLQK